MTVMTIPQQRGTAVARHRVEPVSRPTPWLDWLWIVPLIAVVLVATVVAGCWIVDLLSAVDFGTANTLATFASGTVTVAALWRWFL